ncbi:MAG: complex I subunit 1 family protein [archaeon]
MTCNPMILLLEKAIFIAVASIFIGLIYKGFDRKLGARMQARIGPPLRQPFRDVRKLMLKESIVPKYAVPWLFNLMPVVALASTMAILLYLPFGPFAPLLHGYGDLILILYLLMIPALALVIGGFASGSPFATIGAQREMVQMMSYEFPLAVVAVSVAWLISNSVEGVAGFSLVAIGANPIWGLVGALGFIGIILLFISLMVVMPIELGRIPFDAPEAETEVAGGFIVEYSGRNMAMFYLADAVKTIVFGSLIIAIFFPWGIAGVLGLTSTPALIADLIFYLLKLFVIIFFGSILAHVAFARLKIDQIVWVYWVPCLMIGIAGLVLIGLDKLLGVVM